MPKGSFSHRELSFGSLFPEKRTMMASNASSERCLLLGNGLFNRLRICLKASLLIDDKFRPFLSLSGERVSMARLRSRWSGDGRFCLV
jgi:hypothetical protein